MPSSLRKRLYAFAFVDEFGPIYAVYPLWFAAQGLSTPQISLVYVCWAAVGILLEIPSGALADRVDRRRLVAFALLLRAVGISTWMLVPGVAGVTTGALLWAVHTALASGAMEAMVYDELTATGEEESYATVMARMGQANHLGIAGGTALSAAVLAAGWGMKFAGYATVILHLPAILLILSLPRSLVVEEEGVTFEKWLATLREGAKQVVHNTRVFRLVALGCLLEGLFVLDEYVHLLSKERGASDSLVAVLVGVVWVGLLLGGELAARRPSLSSRWLGFLLSVCGALTVLGLLSGSLWGAAGLGLAYAGLNATWVLSDARMQEKIQSSSRATVTSVRSFFSSFTEMAALGAVGLLAIGNDPTRGLILLVLVLVALGPFVAAWATKTETH